MSPNHRSVFGTLINIAAFRGHLDIVKYLMNNKYYPKMFADPSPLMSAAAGGHVSVLKYFIEDKQCSPFIINSRGSTLVHSAAQSGNLKMVEYVVRELQCKPLLKNKYQEAPLHITCGCYGRTEVTRFLICELNADPDTSGWLGFKPIHYASGYGHLDLVKCLVEEFKCDTNSVAVSVTPLHLAAMNGHLDVVRYLIEKNADPFHKDNRGYTPLHWAAAWDQLEVVKFLASLVDHRALNHSGQTPLHLALKNQSAKNCSFT